MDKLFGAIVLTLFLASVVSSPLATVLDTSSYGIPAQADPSLTGNFADHGVDLDSDGKYDYLAIDAEVEATVEGYYEVYIDGLESPDDSYIYVDNYSYVEDMTVGTHYITVFLSGGDIYNSHHNGPYEVVYVELYVDTDTSSYDDYLDYPYTTTTAYSYTDFETFIPEPYLTDEYSDYGLDLNSDGFYEYLVLEVGFNATVAGIYDVDATLYVSGDGHNYFIGNTTETDSLPIGVYSIPVYLSGPEIRATGIDGPYTVWEASIQSGSAYDYDIAPYTTAAYLCTQFEGGEGEEEESYLTGVFDDYGQDNDLDGKYEALMIEVQFNITSSGSYKVGVYGLISVSGDYIYVSNETEFWHYEVGVHAVAIFLSGPEIHDSGLNGPYTLWYVSLQGDEHEDLLTNAYFTAAYSYDEFEDIAYSYLTGRYADYGIDSDSNGWFNYLAITVEVNITVPAPVYLEVSGLRTPGGDSISAADWTVSDSLPLGVHNLTVYLPGEDIFLSGKDGPYRTWLVLLRSGGVTVDFEYYAHTTGMYSHTDFEPVLRISNVAPTSGDLLSSRDVTFTWITNMNATTDLFVKPDGGSYVHYTGNSGTSHLVTVNDLQLDTRYIFYATATSGDLFDESSVQWIYVGTGIAFDADTYNVTIERDYDQRTTVAVTNYDSTSHRLLLSVESPYPDLIVGFAGNGSIDRTVLLSSHQTMHASLVIHAQDAMACNYVLTLVLRSLGDSPAEEELVDYALLDVTLRDDISVNFTLAEVDDNPATLTKTFNLTNHGDTMTDFRVYGDSALERCLVWDPSVQHLRLEPNASVLFTARLVVDWDFTGSMTGIVFASAFGTQKNTTVTYAGDGDIFYGTGDASFFQIISDWFCTNRPQFEEEFKGVPGMDFPDPKAMITSVDGDVYVDGFLAYPGMEMYPGNTISSRGGTAEVELADGTRFTLGPNGKMVFTDASYGEYVWDQIAGAARYAAGSVFGRRIQFNPRTPNAVVGVRGTEFTLVCNKTEHTTEVLLYDGSLFLQDNYTGVRRALATDTDYSYTYEAVRIYDEMASVFRILFRTSTDFGKTWSGNLTLLSSASLGNQSIGVGEDSRIFLTYEDADTILYMFSDDFGATWSSPMFLASGGVSDPYVQLEKESGILLIGWSNSSGTFFRNTRDNGQTWSPEKRAPSYRWNVISAFLEVDFGLRSPLTQYRPHDVVILINDQLVAMLNHTIPRGTYLFPFDPGCLNYTNGPGTSTNTIRFTTVHMNGAHYVVTTRTRILVRLSELAVPVYAHSQSEADTIADSISCICFNSTDLATYTNLIEAPTAVAMGSTIQLNATVLNMGDNVVAGAVVRFYQSNHTLLTGNQIGSDLVLGAIEAGANTTVSLAWTVTQTGEFIRVQVLLPVDDTELSNNLAYTTCAVRSAADDAPHVTVIYPNGAEAVEDSVYITWDASDPNGEQLSFTIYYGDTAAWSLIASGVTTLYGLWDTTAVANGQYRIRVVATNGLFSSEDVSDALFMVNNTVTTTTTTTSGTTTSTTGSFLDREMLGIKLWVWMAGGGAALMILVVMFALRRRGGR